MTVVDYLSRLMKVEKIYRKPNHMKFLLVVYIDIEHIPFGDKVIRIMRPMFPHYKTVFDGMVSLCWFSIFPRTDSSY